MASNRSNVWRALSASRPPAGLIAATAAGFILSAVLGALPPLFTGRIVDALQRLDATGAMRQLAAYVGLTLCAGCVQAAGAFASAALRESVVRNLRLALMNKLYKARLDDLAGVTLGEIANRVMGDTENLCNQLEFAFLPTLSGIATVIATAVVMVRANWQLALISLCLVSATMIPLKIVTPILTGMQKRISAMRDDLCGIVNETATLSALSILRNALASSRQTGVLASLTAALRGLRMRQSAAAQAGTFGTTLLSLMGPVAILAVGTQMLLTHRVGSVGILVAFLMFHSRLAGPVSSLTTLPMQLASLSVIACRLLDIFDLRDESSGNAAFQPGNIGLHQVEVRRNGRTVLSADIEVPEGDHVAIVGPSGSGKSTLTALLLRLYDPDCGAVRIGKRELREFDLAELRASVAIVSQDPLVFDTTLLENVTYTNPGAPLSDVQRALRICALEPVVERLPQGMSTRLGQRGFRLSGGERQRICLARALVQQPKILVLDEALTGVDVEMESAIIDAIRKEWLGRTLLVVTHRPSIAALFDRVIQVDDSRVRYAPRLEPVSA
jgi:ATP-binding cassette subfamily B protein